MALGVPMTPLVLVTGGVLLLTLFTSLLVSLTLIPIIITMRAIARKDDQQFRLLGLKLWCRVLPHRNLNHRFWQSSAYGPLSFKKR
jgi:type IV secretory pathway VirB3-like protein